MYGDAGAKGDTGDSGPKGDIGPTGKYHTTHSFCSLAVLELLQVWRGST